MGKRIKELSVSFNRGENFLLNMLRNKNFSEQIKKVEVKKLPKIGIFSQKC